MRGGVVAEREVDFAKIFVRARIVGSEMQRGFELLDRFRQPAGTGEGGGEIVVTLGVVRLEPQRGFVMR